MKIAIIGAGNMGGAIACGLAASGEYKAGEIVCANPSLGKLDALKSRYDIIATTTDNLAAANGADMVIIAVKPWLAESVIKQISGSFDTSNKMLVSVVANTSFEMLSSWVSQCKCPPALFRVIPNTAISVGESMTFVAADCATQEQTDMVMNIFGKMGEVMLVDEKMLEVGMVLASCGIAFALRYIRAASEGGVELGCPAAQATRIVAATLKGAAELLLHNNSHPEQEIDKVTTPGGITIKGLNEMEHAGFSSAVIKGLIASAGKIV
ncbi:MAG: pyrroline-5-carboxylate reductase [Alistipes sp.]|nr:pyrroline-5-carboxylate reductase [Alistipes sp.]